MEIIKCNNCDSELLEWIPVISNKGSVQNGMLSINELTTEFALGCQECSETIKIVSGDRIAGFLNKKQEFSI